MHPYPSGILAGSNSLGRQTFLIYLDLIGVVVFASTGAVLAIREELDVFGVAVIAFVSGLGGGMLRDVLLGAVPPIAITDWRYLAVGCGAGFATFAFPHVASRLRRPFIVLDAFGLGLFAVAGTLKALEQGLEPSAAVVLGLLTAAGGGALRDVLVGRIPSLFRGEIYALAALVGSVLTVIGREVQLKDEVVIPLAVCAAALSRLMAVRLGWKAPTRASQAQTTGRSG